MVRGGRGRFYVRIDRPLEDLNALMLELSYGRDHWCNARRVLDVRRLLDRRGAEVFFDIFRQDKTAREVGKVRETGKHLLGRGVEHLLRGRVAAGCDGGYRGQETGG